MKVLIVAANWMEVKFLIDECECISEKSHLLKQYNFKGKLIDILVTGVGTTFTTFHLTSTLRENDYDLVLNIGIAGSLSKDIKVGDVVNVISEEFADLGIEGEEEEDFMTLFEAGFIDSSDFPFENGILKSASCRNFDGLKKVRGLTSNTSHGTKSSIARLQYKFSAKVESMEGAAVFYVCNWLGIECCQIRSISNYIDEGEHNHWNIPLALFNLKETIAGWLLQEEISVVASGVNNA